MLVINNKRRAILRKVIEMLENAINKVDEICEQERDVIDNYPENLQNSERFEKLEDGSEKLEEALNELEDTKCKLEEAINLIEASIS